MPSPEEELALYREAPRGPPKITPRKLIIPAIAAISFLWLVSDSPIYFAQSLHGKVVDATTNKPLQGVVVMAEWMLQPNVAYLSQSVRLHALETITDADGNYALPGWGPRLRPPGLALANLSPRMVFIYPGYYPDIEINGWESPQARNKAMIRSSIWDGKTIGLRQFDGNWELLRNYVSSAWSPIWGCGFECPKLIGRAISANRYIDRNKPKNLRLGTDADIDSLSPELRAAVTAQPEYAN
jgi:hypothetical protein